MKSIEFRRSYIEYAVERVEVKRGRRMDLFPSPHLLTSRYETRMERERDDFGLESTERAQERERKPLWR